ncbi:MAG: hypothetical protein A2Y57_00770 [Candidatus Woykebacteria bacterium RBG_13_40_7b]|uniref:Uncharacterized protein n=1 Tax=Candidatus Woykebacteria bacterium RBG_13_40_7b TaxID=1802594 RepID=A0A1G1WAC7_9BACT|nr:MAG: hypothetical protein A2Y57_00770 [Candidatus Woykebacteria bacterium RBG_13_40_7b]
MNFINDPQKSKNVFILMLVISIVLFVGLVILGFLFYQKSKSYKSLEDERRALQAEQSLISKDTVNQIKTLTAENTSLKKENATLTSENTALKSENEDLTANNQEKAAKMAKASVYNDFLAYLVQIIQAHNGLSGWTEAEYQAARTKAQATGDQTFVELIDWAWTSTTIDQVERLTKVLDSISDNIGNNVK